jgi:hypothetical protein
VTSAKKVAVLLSVWAKAKRQRRSLLADAGDGAGAGAGAESSFLISHFSFLAADFSHISCLILLYQSPATRRRRRVEITTSCPTDVLYIKQRWRRQAQARTGKSAGYSRAIL